MARSVWLATIGLATRCAVPAWGEEAPRLEVGVGETVERDVGIAQGLRCDDVAIARIELRERTAESNVLVVTGVAPGTTLCRVGLTVDRPTYVFEIRVRRR